MYNNKGWTKQYITVHAVRVFVNSEFASFFLFWNICSQLGHIKDVQNAINTHDFVNKVLPHIARRSDSICREVLAFLSIMLFNANREVQVSDAFVYALYN